MFVGVHVCACVCVCMRAYACVLPVMGCSRLAPELCPLEEAAACGALPWRPPHSHKPGPGREWMQYLTVAPAGDF